MAAKLTTLLELPTTRELVRDKIATILLEEVAQQEVLAAAADPPQDPRLYHLDVFTERADPWSEWGGNPDQIDAAPIVSIRLDEWKVLDSSSNVVKRQTVEAVYAIDCYGYGVSAETGGGHTAGDKKSAFEAHRAAGLVSRILMAGEYTYLDLRGVVGKRMVEGGQSFQPIEDQRPVENVWAERLTLKTQFNEFSPQYEGVPLATIGVTLKRTETGQVFLTQTHDHT